MEIGSNTTVTDATTIEYVHVFRSMAVVPRLCCLEWAISCVHLGGSFWFEDGPSIKGIYDSRRGESPCPRCDGFRHDNGFCGQCGQET